jgi:F-type H+-transporting ATPase subunit b
MKASSRLVVWCAALAIVGLLFVSPSSAGQPDHKGEKGGAAEAGEHGGADQVAAARKPNPLGFDPDLALFTFIVFACLFLVLKKFAWPQISAALLEREKRIEDQIAAATAKHEDAKRVLAKHEARLAAAAGEVRALLDEARRDAEQTRKTIETQGHQAAKDELDRAIREIKRAKDGAIEELAKASANVAVDMAHRVVREKITPDEHAALVRRAMGELATIASSKN